MALVLNNGRQNPLVVVQDIVLADLASTVAKTVAKMPINSMVTGGYFVVTEVWNSTSSDALDFGHSDDDDEYTATAVNLQALGITALTLTGYLNSSGYDIIAVSYTHLTLPTKRIV